MVLLKDFFEKFQTWTFNRNQYIYMSKLQRKFQIRYEHFENPIFYRNLLKKNNFGKNNTRYKTYISFTDN